MNIHISNLSLNVMESDLRKLFAAYGEVSSTVIIRDLHNGRSRGTAFIDMFRDKEGTNAIQGLHRILLDGKKISVTELEYDPATYKN